MESLEQGLNLSMWRGQGYDGARNMAGIIQGAAAKICGKYTEALHVHCVSHKLNQCIAHSCQLTSITNMMDMANFLKYSPQMQKALEGHVNDHPDALGQTCSFMLNPLGGEAKRFRDHT